jgi:hypothetical protein
MGLEFGKLAIKKPEVNGVIGNAWPKFLEKQNVASPFGTRLIKKLASGNHR